MLVAFATTFACITASAQEDCTSKITNPGFTDDSSTAQSGWTLVSGSAKGKWSKGTENRAFSCNNIKCELTQTVEGLAPGTYQLKFQAFGRMKANDASWTSYLAGEDLSNTNVYVIANDTKKEVKNVVYGATPTKGTGTWTTVTAADGSSLYLLDNSGAVADAFAQGYYEDVLYAVVGADGKLKITFLKESEQDNSSDYSKYAGCDNFRLYGPIAAIPAEDVAALVASAPTGKMNGAINDAMATAIKALQAEASVANYDAVVKAIDAAKASVTAYNAVKEALDKAEKTQLSDAARAEYNTAVESIVKAYNEGTMTGDGSEQVAAIEKALGASQAKDAAGSKDKTNLIKNAQFNDGIDGWEGDFGAGAKKGTADNYLITSYGKGFNIYQNIEGLEPGVYKLQVQAFSRPLSNSETWTAYCNGETLENLTTIYANGAEKKALLIVENYLTEKGSTGSWSTCEKDGANVYIPNDSKAFAVAFSAGLYENELYCIVKEDGKLTIGIKNESTSSSTYAGYDNFRLTLVAKAKVDYTDKLANPSFDDKTNGWTVNTGKIEVKAASTGNPVVTAYGYQVDICQKVTGLEPGKYIVKVQACSRYKDKAAGIADYEAKKAAGEEIPNEAYLYANGVQKKVVNIWDEGADYDFAKESGQAASDLTLSNGKQIPYNSTNFANAFGKLGMYENELVCEVKEDGELTIGIKNELSGDGYTPYIGYDNFRLYRYQDASAIISEAGYATVAYREDVAVPQGVKAYVVSGIEGQVLTLEEITAIPANTGVVLEGAAGYYAVTAAASAVAPVEKNLLSAKFIGEKIPVGNYVLQSQNEKVGFYKLDKVRAAEKDCAYLSVPAAAAGVKAFFFDADEETAIETIEVLTSGKAQIYDLNGRKLNSLQKGINIVNGKKVLVK